MIARLREHMRTRLRDTRGFMLAEQLVSVIFLGLLCVVVAAGLGAALSAYGNITKQTRADALLSQAVELVSDELVYALSVEGGGSFPAFVSATQNETMQFYSPDSGVMNGIMFATDSGSSLALVPARDGLVPALEQLSYDESAGTWSFLVQVKSGNDTLAEADMTVHRIGS